MGYEERTTFLRTPLHLQRQIQPHGILKFSGIVAAFFMNLVQSVLDSIFVQKCFLAGFFEGHVTGKINTKEFKVFRRKRIQSFRKEGFFVAGIYGGEDQFQIQ